MLDLIEIAGCNAEYNFNADCVDLRIPSGYVYRLTLHPDKSHIETVFETFSTINHLLIK
jgi:hypothetical protein